MADTDETHEKDSAGIRKTFASTQRDRGTDGEDQAIYVALPNRPGWHPLTQYYLTIEEAKAAAGGTPGGFKVGKIPLEIVYEEVADGP